MDLTSPTIAAPNFNFPTQLDPSNPLLRFIPSPASAASAPVIPPPVMSASPGSGSMSLNNPFVHAGSNRASFSLPAPQIAPPASINQVLANNSQLLSQNHDNLNQDLLTTKALAREQAAQQRVDYLTRSGSGVDQIAHPVDANGNPTNQHPGFWRRLGSIGAHIGDTALTIAAPGIAALTPGTTFHHQMLLNQAEGQEGQAQQQVQGQALLAETQARTAQDQAQAGEQTAEGNYYGAQAQALPGKTAADIALQQAQAYRAIHPLAASAFDLWHQQNPNGTAQDYETMMQKPLSQQQADSMNGVWDKLAAKSGLPTGQFRAGMPAADANALSASLNNVVARGQGAQNIVIRQQEAAEKVPMLIPDGKGGYTLQYLQPGQSVAPGAVTPTQGGSANTPTNTERTAAGRAQVVLKELPNVLSAIDQNRDQLGPIMGHWNDFMQGRVGADNPQFAALRSDLLMMSSAVALAHAQGRLPENLREEFDKAINAPQQNPDNLKATLTAMQPWLQDMVNLGTLGGNASGANAGAPQPIVQHSASTGKYRYSTDGGRTWQQGKPVQR